MLRRLYIDNYRCLTNFEIKPEQVVSLVGPNGGGKSTVLEVLQLLQNLLFVGAPLKQAMPDYTRSRWDQRPVQRFELDAGQPGGVLYSYSAEIQLDEASKEPTLREERLTADGQLVYQLESSQVHLFGDDAAASPKTTFPFTATRSFLPLLEPGPDNRHINAFKQWLAGVWLFSLSPKSIEAYSRQEERSLLSSGANFVSWYRRLVQERPELSLSLREDLRPVIPGLSSIRLWHFEPTGKTLNLECELAGRSFELNLSELSDGQRALLVLYTILHAITANASLLAFDEPDNFVAQAEIQPWLSTMREVVVNAGGGNLLVISHHPEVIDYLAPDQTFYLWRGEEGPTRLREPEVDREQGLYLSEWLKLGVGDGG